jgi:hypothetical protein
MSKNRKNRLDSKLWVVFIGVFLSFFNQSWAGEYPNSPYGRYFDRIVTIVFENKDFEDVMEDEYFNSLAKKGVLFTNFHAVARPSQPNYIAMVAGDTLGVRSNESVTLFAPHIGNLLNLRGMSWKNYADSYPGNCFLGSQSGPYVRKHVPFISFKSVQSDPVQCAQVVHGDQFIRDWKSRNVPQYAFYSPDLDTGGHDTELEFASNWLKQFLEPLLADPAGMERTLIQITFDESENFFDPINKIYTVFLGPTVRPGITVKTSTNFYNVLRTIEDNFFLGTLGLKDSKAKPVEGIWASS